MVKNSIFHHWKILIELKCCGLVATDYVYTSAPLYISGSQTEGQVRKAEKHNSAKENIVFIFSYFAFFLWFNGNFYLFRPLKSIEIK